LSLGYDKNCRRSTPALQNQWPGHSYELRLELARPRFGLKLQSLNRNSNTLAAFTRSSVIVIASSCRSPETSRSSSSIDNRTAWPQSWLAQSSTTCLMNGPMRTSSQRKRISFDSSFPQINPGNQKPALFPRNSASHASRMTIEARRRDF